MDVIWALLWQSWSHSLADRWLSECGDPTVALRPSKQKEWQGIGRSSAARDSILCDPKGESCGDQR